MDSVFEKVFHSCVAYLLFQPVLSEPTGEGFTLKVLKELARVSFRILHMSVMNVLLSSLIL